MKMENFSSCNPWDCTGPSQLGSAFGRPGGTQRPANRAAPKRNESQRLRESRIDLNAMYEYRKQGRTWVECGREFGCCASNARAMLLKHFPDSGGYCTTKRLDHAEVELLISMRAQNMSYRQIANARGHQINTVHYRIKRSSAVRAK